MEATGKLIYDTYHADLWARTIGLFLAPWMYAPENTLISKREDA